MTGDYPITTYTWPGAVCLFFMVIAAVGMVSIHSVLIAGGLLKLSKAAGQTGKMLCPEELPAMIGINILTGFSEVSHLPLRNGNPKWMLANGPA